MSEDLTIIILTKNESTHLKKYLPSALDITEKVIIVDSFSDDDTIDIAKSFGAQIYQHVFINHADQINWALANCLIDTPWVMRLDADEYATPELANEIHRKLKKVPANITGIVLKRRLYFMGKWIRHGGYYPIRLLRIWRRGVGKSENQWMDEHIVLSHGDTMQFEYDFIDENLKSLTWWTEKHNQYSTREVVDLLNRKYDLKMSASSENVGRAQSGSKRWLKNNFYSSMPLFLRTWFYFNYRYFFQFGFLDGRRGLVWHFLQGFWYRFLVDAKIMQIEWWAKNENKTVKQILEEKFDFKF